MKGLTKRSFMCINAGVCFILIGCISILFRYPLYEYIKYLVIHISPNSEMIKHWTRNQFPMKIDFYVFNWTNSIDIYDRRIKPNFVEIGPYSYDEIREKVNLTWNDNNNTISFYVKRTWFYQENERINLDANITIPNTINLVAVEKHRYKSYLAKKSVSMLISTVSPGIAVHKPVRKILFDGYNDFMLSLGNMISTENIPNLQKFAFFYGRNASAPYDGYFNVDLNYENLGQVLEWNYRKTSKGMPKQCNHLQSSIFDLFKHDINKEDQFEFYFADICRPLRFNFDGEVEINGLKCFKYIVGDRMLDNGTKVAGNECYCNGECYPSGLINASGCRDAPAFLSLPHFYNADPSYGSRVDGMMADKEKHEFYIILEPKTGIIIDISARLQLNVFLNPDRDILLYATVPKIFLPVLWFEQRFRLPDNIVFKIALLIELPKILLLVGIVVILIGIIIIFFTMRTILKNKHEMNKKFKMKLKEMEMKQNLKHKLSN